MSGNTSKKETGLARTHLNAMGRDEMNLAEFPLATLADRAPRGCKTLVFEDTIWDKSQRQQITRRLTISASDKYGLPTALDDEVILGLVQLSMAQNFGSRRVPFSRYQLIRLLGWRDEGKSYTRLEQSLKRWLGVTLYYDNAWRDNCRKRWVDANFHLLDQLVLYHRPRCRSARTTDNPETLVSSFTWNEIVFQSFQAGYLRKLDMEFYRGLKQATSKRMFRFLEKKFYFADQQRFNLKVFACEHVGLSRNYDAAQLKRRLNPAIQELERLGYLRPMPTAERYCCLRRGEWEIAFVRAPKVQIPERQARHQSELERRLTERGVTPSSAARLVRDYPADRIQAKLDVFDDLSRQRNRLITKNPAGFLVQSIRDDYLPPAGFRPKPRLAAVTKPDKGDRREGILPATIVSPESDLFHEEQSAELEYLSHLSGAERQELEAGAFSAARGLPAEGYKRAIADGNDVRAAHYRQVILERHVSQIIGTTSRQRSRQNVLRRSI